MVTDGKNSRYFIEMDVPREIADLPEAEQYEVGRTLRALAMAIDTYYPESNAAGMASFVPVLTAAIAGRDPGSSFGAEATAECWRKFALGVTLEHGTNMRAFGTNIAEVEEAMKKVTAWAADFGASGGTREDQGS